MADDSHVTDQAGDELPRYPEKSADADDAVTVSISTTPGEWLVNTVDSVVVPMSMAELVELLRAGKLTERSLVWRIGMQEWASVDKVPQLKLAARLPSTPRPSSAPASSPSAPTSRTKPPPKPVRSAPPAQVGLSRRSTLPFGLPAPKVTPLPRPAIAPARSADEPVIAVYARPAATISFDLSAAESARAPAPAAPGTLAPTTSDAVPQLPPSAAFTGDLSVVSTLQLRATQRSARRRVVACSLASAAAASLLTFWLARSTAPAPTLAASRAREPLAALSPPVPAAPPVPATPAVGSSQPALIEGAPDAAVTPAAPAPKTKPRRARPVRVQPVARPSESEPDPSSQPNPYAARLEEEAPRESKKPSLGAGERAEPEPPAATDSSPPVLDLTQ